MSTGSLFLPFPSRMRRSRVHLEKHFDPDTARQLDALIKGLTLHRALAREPHDRALAQEAVARVTTTDRRTP